MRLILSMFIALATLASLGHSSADAVTRTWPGAVPCAGTLQACINASASGDGVQIVTDTPVAETLNLPRSITLEGGSGFSARLATGFGINGSSTGNVDYNVAIRRIALTDARIELTHASTGVASIEIRRTRIASNTATSAAGIRVHALDAGTTAVRVSDNRLRFAAGPAGIGILIEFTGTDGSALADFNHVENTEDGGWGIYSETDQQSTVSVTLVDNEVRGRYGFAAIGISEGRFSTATNSVTARVIGNAVNGHNRLGNGILFFGGNGSIASKTVNNSTVDLDYGLSFQRWTPGSGGSISGTVSNNLIFHNRVGLALATVFQAPLVETNNLLFDNLGNSYTPSASDISSDPLLHSLTDLRLHPGSPAINAANSLDTLDAYTSAGVGVVDADGLRRFKAAVPDIGAYESGDFSLRARAGAPSGNSFIVNHAALNGNPNARLFATIFADYISNLPAFGAYYATGSWRIFNQNLAAMPLATEFNVFVPTDGDGTFTHTATPGNLSGHFTTINNSALNNLPNRIILVTPNWNPGGGAGVYNNHSTSIGYFPPSWFVLNNDFAAMSVGAAFNIYSQDPSPNAYVHTANSANSSGMETILDQPLINGSSCAYVHLTPRTGAQADTTFDLYYHAGLQRWIISNNHDVNMADGASFNVVIDAAQVAACSGVMFRDGFEN